MPIIKKFDKIVLNWSKIKEKYESEGDNMRVLVVRPYYVS